MTAAFLIPEEIFSKLWKENPHDFSHYEKTFKVSQPALFVAALKRGYISKTQYNRYIEEYNAAEPAARRSSGGDFYKILPNRIGRSFSQYVFSAVQEGRVLYSDACRLLGLHGDAFMRAMRGAGEA